MQKIVRNGNITITSNTNDGHWMVFEEMNGLWSPVWNRCDKETRLIHYHKIPKVVYINEEKKTVVLKWENETITKVKATQDDTFDARYGFLLAYFQKHCGMTKNKANRYLEKIVAKEEK